MAGKKKEEVDAAKDFFGEEGDWFLDDDAPKPGSAAPETAAAPTAEPEPAAAPAVKATEPPVPVDARPAPVLPAAESTAPTMMFSLDQLPDIPMPVETPAYEKPAETLTSFPALDSLVPLPDASSGSAPDEATDDTELSGPARVTEVIETQPEVEAPSSVAETAERTAAEAPAAAIAAPTDEPVEAAAEDSPSAHDGVVAVAAAGGLAPAPASEQTEEMVAEMLDAPSEVLVRTTGSPPPLRVAAPNAGADTGPQEHSPPPVFHLARFVPGTEVDDWRAAVGFLEGEGAMDPERRGAWLTEAGLLAIRRVGDAPTAEGLLTTAAGLGAADGVALRVLEEVAAASGRWEAALFQVEARAGLAVGTAAADAWYEAALLARHQLGRASAALVHLETASIADSEHFAAISLRRDLLVESGERTELLADVLGRLGQLSDGWLSAEAWSDQAELYEALGRPTDARVAWERAVAASPNWGPAGAGLENVFLVAGDQEALAALYARESERAGSDAAWWWILEARARAELSQFEKARTAFQAAFASGDPSALREWEAWERSRGDTAGVVSALQAQATAGDSWTNWRLSVALEADNRAPEALAVVAALVASEAEAWPAVESLARLLKTASDPAALRDSWRARWASATGDEARAVAVVVGELALQAGEAAAAVEAWAPLVDGGDFPARVAAARLLALYRSEGDVAGYASVALKRAAWASNPRRANDHRWSAATGVGPVDLALAEEVLAVDPGHPGALERVVAGGGARAAQVLEAATADADPLGVAALSYEAARAWLAAGNPDEAKRVVGGIGLSHALVDLLVEDLDVDRAERWRSRADNSGSPVERAWGWFAAGTVHDLEKLHAADPEHSGALAAIEVARLGEADPARRIELYFEMATGQPTPARALLTLRLASELARAGRSSEAASALTGIESMNLPNLPVRVAALLAEGLGEGAIAARLIGHLHDPPSRLELARILDRAVGDSAAALAVYVKVLSGAEDALASAPSDGAGASGARALVLDAGLGVARTALAVGDRAAWIAGHSAVARTSGRAPQRAAYAGWVASWLEEDARLGEALPFARQAVEGRPGSEDAFDTLVRILQQAGDSAAIRQLFEARHPGDALRLADALEGAGDSAGQREVLSAALERATEPVALLTLMVHMEVLLSRAGEWQSVYDMLSRRREGTRDEASRAAIDARRRWLLAEKLSDTEQAWELYRQLHLDAPADREVTTALARIASARGEHALAVQFIRELAESAPSPEEAARCQRLVATICETMGNPANARQAYLDALDHVPDDQEALVGLKRLARAGNDWQALIAVLKREAGMADDARRLDLRREIAQVEDRPDGDPALAADAWRDVLEHAPRDREALDRLFELSRAAGRWETLVEVGTLRVDLVPPEEQGALLDYLGEIATQHLDAGDGATFYERAIAASPPSVSAARKLEKVYRGRNDAKAVAGVLEVLAVAEPEVADRTDALCRLAKQELEVRRDRDAAAAYYQRAFALDPTQELSARFLGGWLIDTGRLAEALPVYASLEQNVETGQDLDDPDARLEIATYWFQFGELLRGAGRVDDAISRYKRALELSPAHQLALEALGSVWLQKGEWKEAGKAFSQLLQVTGGQGERSKVAHAYTQLGMVERALGSAEKAEKRFVKALEVFPNHVGALKGTGRLAEDRQDWNALMSIFNAVIVHATVPGDVVDAYMTKGRVLDEHLGRADKAAQHYQRSLDFDPNQPVALLRLSEISARASDWAETGLLAARGLKLEPGPELQRVRPALLLLSAVAAARQGLPSEGQAAEAAAVDPRFAISLDDLDAVRAAVRLVW